MFLETTPILLISAFFKVLFTWFSNKSTYILSWHSNHLAYAFSIFKGSKSGPKENAFVQGPEICQMPCVWIQRAVCKQTNIQLQIGH